MARAEAQSAAELFKKGVDLYKAGKYDAAAHALEKSLGRSMMVLSRTW